MEGSVGGTSAGATSSFAKASEDRGTVAVPGRISAAAVFEMV
jgi:hypothetical protein